MAVVLSRQVADLLWSNADLPINDSLSRETLDDISCDSYVPPQPAPGWDLDSLEVDTDDYTEDGAVKVLDMLAPSWGDASQGRVLGRRQEREDRKKTLSTSFETNIDDIEFDTESPGLGVPNVGKVRRPFSCQLGQLSLASLRGRLIEYQLRLGFGQECHVCRVAGNTVSSHVAIQLSQMDPRDALTRWKADL